MLSSITPLGERSRGSSWSLTATAFAAGAIGAGTAGGALLGGLGSLLPGGTQWRGVALLVVLAAALLFDGTSLRARLPTVRRQVNEDWLGRYRGWVVGIGFGAQLGVGVATIVTAAAVYATLACALLCPSIWAGAIVGACFGLVRALSLLPARRARDAASLAALHRRLGALDGSSRTLLAVGEAAAVLITLGALVA